MGARFCHSSVDALKIIFRLLLRCLSGLLGTSIDITIPCLVFIGFSSRGREITSCLEFTVNVTSFSLFMSRILGSRAVILARFFMLFSHGVS